MRATNILVTILSIIIAYFVPALRSPRLPRYLPVHMSANESGK